ncbi:DUF7426 family protein [Rhodococcoides fascians]|uniref:DUF7426 family protein n=1 Tax=Rhodococcoides fascians TaxID=1828 RepID=UPI0037A36C0D
MFADLDEVLDGGLPIRAGGHRYLIPEPTIAEGLALVRAFVENDGHFDDATEQHHINVLLKGVRDQMSADGVGKSKTLLAGKYALIHYLIGPGTARDYVLKHGVVEAGKPQTPTPKRRRGKRKN